MTKKVLAPLKKSAPTLWLTSRRGFANLNTNDIESVEVLKDASAAAIYGSRGSNGVVSIFRVFTYNWLYCTGVQLLAPHQNHPPFISCHGRKMTGTSLPKKKALRTA